MAELTGARVTTVVVAMVFLSTRHEWNMALLDRKGCASFDGWRVPENEIYEAMHVMRRKLVHWLREKATQSELDVVMDSVVRVSASTGSLLPRPDEIPNRWAHVLGEYNAGRFALHSSRSKNRDATDSPVPLSRQTTSGSAADPEQAAPGDRPPDLEASLAAKSGELGDCNAESSVAVSTASAASQARDEGAHASAGANTASDSNGPAVGSALAKVVGMPDSADLAVEVDVQVMQLTLKASHPQALPTDVARLKDVVEIFGEVSMQACLTEQSTSRACYRLVGRSHDIEHWPNKDPKLPLLDQHYRAYFPDELYPSEKIWLPSVFEPVRRAYLLFPKPLEILMPEEPLPEDAQCAYLVGKQPEQGGVWREFFVYRARRMVHVYRIESHGRRFYRSLEYTSDARFCLREMQPSTAHRETMWAPWERYGAGHPYADSHNQTKSAVITRDWTVDGNLSLGKETYVPSRLLYGILPQALLDSHVFWQDEDDHLRGYPRDPATCTDVIYVRLVTGAHVAFYGARFDRASTGELALPPTRAIVLRLKLARLQRQWRAVLGGLEALERFVRDKELIVGPFEPTFQVCKALAGLLRRQGNHAFSAAAASAKRPAPPSGPSPARPSPAASGGKHATGATNGPAAGGDPNASVAPSADDADFAQLEQLLSTVELTAFRRRRRRHRVSAVVLPILLDSLAAALSATGVVASPSALSSRQSGREPKSNASTAATAASTPAPKANHDANHADGDALGTGGRDAGCSTASTADGMQEVVSASELEEEELVLLDLLHAPMDSYLYSLATVMARIENLSQVLVWARWDEFADLTQPTSITQSDVRIVSLPRLKLTFQARRVGESVRLVSVDHSDLFITNERNSMTTELLAGIPHSLLLSNSNGEMAVLVPSVPPVRPSIASVPFSTELVLDRSDRRWHVALENPFYVYPVHVSLSFLYSTTLASAFYLLLLRYLSRQYRAVVQLVDTVACDTDLTVEENNSLQFMVNLKNSEDCHPDAHACRLKISLVMLDSPVALPWDLSVEMSSYVRKLQHVTANCRLSPEEELTLLAHCVCDPADRRFDESVHTHYMVLLCKNRRSALRARAQGRTESVVEVPTRPEEWRWIYAWHPQVLQQSPAQMEQLLSEVAQKYSHNRSVQLDGMLSVLSTVNSKGPLPAGVSIASGGFLVLYNMLQGATQCRVHSTNCSQSFATLLMPFFSELREQTLLSSLLLTLARKPLLGPFLPEFVDNRKYKRRDVFTGLPLPDEAEAPLGKLLKSVMHELEDLGGAPRRHEEVARAMLQRRVDALTKERMWGGWGGGWGDAGWGGGGRGGFGGWNGGGGGGWGQSSYARMEELAVETERQCVEELRELADWRSLEHCQPPCSQLPPSPETFCLPSAANDGSWTSLVVSDHSCEHRGLRPVQSCPEVVFSSMVAAYNTSCPISLIDFDEGEIVRRLPGGHLIATECFEQLLDAARKDGKPPTCPFTRAEFAPGVTAAQLAHFCTRPLDVLDLSAVVARVPLYDSPVASTESERPRHTDGEDPMSQRACAIGFDVSLHPDAQSKVARDMQERLMADAEEYARQLERSTTPRCLFLLDAASLVYGDNGRANLDACTAVERSLHELLGELTAQRERDAAYVREALPQILRRANAIDLEHAQPHERLERELFSLRQTAAQEASVTLDFMFCLLISTRSVDDLRSVNPFLTPNDADGLFDLIVSSILHASRVGQINRCVSELHGLLKLVRPRGGSFGETNAALREAVSAITLKAQTLAEQLLTERHYVRAETAASNDHIDERWADPRFLLFEFTHNLVLREAQVELVYEFVSAVRARKPLVKQMLMGGGKTTVVGPLLALLLGDGKMLVVQTMPAALLEQSKATLRATFSLVRGMPLHKPSSSFPPKPARPK